MHTLWKALERPKTRYQVMGWTFVAAGMLAGALGALSSPGFWLLVGVCVVWDILYKPK